VEYHLLPAKDLHFLTADEFNDWEGKGLECSECSLSHPMSAESDFSEMLGASSQKLSPGNLLPRPTSC